MLHIFIDADACPVKDEIYKVSKRHDLRVTVVSNMWMRTPSEPWIDIIVVKGDLDAADDWIAEHVEADDIVITADIPLASRCLKAGGRVLGPRGRPFTEDSIGEALAGREIQAHLRELGAGNSGPPPFVKQDRSRFLQELDVMIHAVKKARSS